MLALALLAAAVAPLLLGRTQSRPSEDLRPSAPSSVLFELDPLARPAPPQAGIGERQRTVVVRVDLLEDAANRPGTQLGFDPPGDQAVLLTSIASQPAWGGGTVYTAQVVDAQGALRGQALFSVCADAVSASLHAGERSLRILPAGRGVQRLVDVADLDLPPCGTGAQPPVPPVAPSAPPSGGGGGAFAASAYAPTVDVMVVYTSEAEVASGGANALQSAINLAVGESNQAYANSDVDLRLRLVHVEEMVGYVETGDFPTELNRLQLMYDGHMDEVHPLRNLHGADAVSLVVASTQYCGYAYILTVPAVHGFEFLAFGVVAQNCLQGTTFAHELAHNMGSDHDVANAAVPSPSYPYSYGWRTANGLWRTVMAYAPGTSVPYFSNPHKTFNGQALGVVDQAENWRSLNDNAPVVAQWRCAVPAPYGTPKATSSGRLPRMRWSGKPVFDGSGGFLLRIEDGEPGNGAICFYGGAAAMAPFQGGVRWVALPVQRTLPQVLDGNGEATFPFPQLTQLQPGDQLYVQGWFRDPLHPDLTASGLTDGLRVDVCEFAN